MHLVEIATTNFRSLLDERIGVDPVTVLIGANGSGKSNLLQCLNFFYTQNYPITEECFYDRDTARPLTVTLTYGALTPRELDAFGPYVENGLLRIAKEAVWANGSGAARYYGMREQCPEFEGIRALSGNPKKLAYNDLTASGRFPGLATVRRIDEVDDALAAWEQAHPDRCTRMRDETQFFGWTGVGAGKIDQVTKWIFIPAVRDASTEGVEGRNSALKVLLDLSLRAKLNDNPALKELRESATARLREILDPAELAELQELSQSLTERLQQFAPTTTVHVGWRDLAEINLSLPTAATQLGEGDFIGPVEHAGHGTQRAFLIAILQHLIDARVRIDATPEGGSPHILLGIEEPEIYLHPVRARLMHRVIRLLSEAREGAAAIQTIYCTHSPLFVDIGRFRSIRLARRLPPQTPGKPNVTRITRSDPGTIARQLAEAHSRPAADFTPDTLLPRLATVMSSGVSEGFFADAVVLVEGEEDRALFNGLAEFLGHDLEAKGIAVIPVGGKSNLDRPLLIFRSLGVPCFTIFDGDRGRKDGHPEANRALLRLHGRPAIDGPETGVWDTGACFRTCFQDEVAAQVGPTFETHLSAVASDLGFEQIDQARKNPIVIRDAIRRSLDGGAAPDGLVRIVNAALGCAQRRE